MWFGKPRAFNNELTKLIQEKGPDLDQVIFHKDLSITLRNGSPILLNFLFSPDNYDKLINYALFDKEAETDEYKDLSIKQINHNAASILSYPNDKLRANLSIKQDEEDKPILLIELERFINDTKYSLDSLYAGHFERIYENALRGSNFSIFFNDNFVHQLLPFLAENILILSYKELFQILLDDFIEEIDPDCLKQILLIILQYATFFSYVTYCDSTQNTLFNSYYEVLENFKNYKLTNNDDKSIPYPELNSKINLKNNVNDNYAKEIGINFFPDHYKSKNPQDFDFEESQKRAFLFLSSIRISFSNNCRNEILQDIDILERILYCGVFSHPESLSSAEAFRILDDIYYGFSEGNDLSKDYINEPFEGKEFYNLIDKYADYISFSNKFLTTQQVYAFSIFWNHRYKDLTDVNQPFVNIDPVYNMENFHIFPQKLTPFLAFRPLLLSDPLYSNKLCFDYFKIFYFMIKKRKRLIGSNPQDLKSYDKETQDDIRNIDFTIYEFIQRKFPLFSEGNYVNFYDAIFQMIPNFPKTPHDKFEPKRTLLNGSIIEICEIIKNSSFFTIHNKPSVLLEEIEDCISYNVFQLEDEYSRRQPANFVKK